MTFPTVPGPMPPSRPAGAARPARPRPPERPPAVRRALVAALLQVPVSLLGLVLLVSDGSLMGDLALLIDDLGFASDGSTAYALAENLPVAFFLVGNALWLWLTAKMWAGRTWARGVLTALGVLTVFSLFSALPSGETATALPAVLSAGLSVAMIVFLFRPESVAWFGRRP